MWKRQAVPAELIGMTVKEREADLRAGSRKKAGTRSLPSLAGTGLQIATNSLRGHDLEPRANKVGHYSHF